MSIPGVDTMCMVSCASMPAKAEMRFAPIPRVTVLDAKILISEEVICQGATRPADLQL